MIYLFKDLPDADIDTSQWHMMLENTMIKKLYSIATYLFMPVLVVALYLLKYDFFYLPKVIQSDNMPGFLSPILWMILILVILLVHELLHIVTIYKRGDVSVTFSRLFVRVNTNVVLRKSQRILCVIFPLLILSAIPGVIALFIVSIEIKSILNFICWTNLILSGYDVSSFFLVLSIPKHSLTYKALYKFQ